MTAVRVPAPIEEEFPGASRSAAEVAANLVQASDAFLAELERRRRKIADLSPSAFQALAIPRGSGRTARRACHRRSAPREQRQHDVVARHPRRT